ncbi:Alpha/Beta hydrolase protein [Piptocephalis cylindrospora]|uniref:Alpha/Beta hydrolase protein n=1 Tax=Piptocephalis cylindrospora TaxID=1907219 RepID=A0A4P9Y5V8_9FUNG|nr:Alpha/Beta hydrolase protein [Piptocephalis cylindrospora]|eukprot:RKP13200.1 Alpha/Beta hydrolase protein [Piptocephalis cylindrospora]
MEKYWSTITKIIPSATPGLSLSTSLHQTIGPTNPQEGPTLLFAHGLGSCKEMWCPILIRMAKLGFRGTCITYDIRTHGESAIINAEAVKQCQYKFRCSDNTADVSAVIRGWNVRKPLIGVGHSIGGCSILMNEVERPYTFRAIIGFEIVSWCESVAHMKADELQTIMTLKTSRKRGQWASREEAADFMRKNQHYMHWDPEALHNFLQYAVHDSPGGKGVALKCPPEIEADGFRGNDITSELAENLYRIRVPVFYVCSPKSPLIPKVMVEENVRRTKGSQRLFVPGTGHSIPYEKLDMTAWEIVRTARLHHPDAVDECTFAQAKL